MEIYRVALIIEILKAIMCEKIDSRSFRTIRGKALVNDDNNNPHAIEKQMRFLVKKIDWSKFLP